MNNNIKIELHLIQNFAPSCLNRDVTNTPKDCEFGGVRRARISSQCTKHSVRASEQFGQILREIGGVRTRFLITEIAKRYSGADNPPDEVVKVIADIFKAGGIERPEVKKGEEETQEKDTTKIILFLDNTAIDDMTRVIRENWSGLADKKDAVVNKLGEILADAVKSPDIALFGRMIEVKASTPFGKRNLRVDASCQVAHAISTHRADLDLNFYTAVDDLNPASETGAGMMGETGFNSACFYRYSLLDRKQLADNLGDERLADDVIRAFIEASVRAIPTGKQNSFAAQNPPSFGLVVVRKNGSPCSLANAFASPVRVIPGGDEDLVGVSIQALDKLHSGMKRVYGDSDIVGEAVFQINYDDRLGNLAAMDKGSLAAAIDAAMEAVRRAAEV